MSKDFSFAKETSTKETIAYNLMEIREAANPTSLRLYKNEWSRPEFQRDFYALLLKHGITDIKIDHERHAIKFNFRIDDFTENCDIVGKSEVTIQP